MRTKTYHLARSAELNSLAPLRGLIDKAAEENPQIDDDTRYDLKLALDEAATNVIEHGYAGMNPGSIMLDVHVHPDKVVLMLTDFGHPFEPSEVPAPDVSAPLEERALGGFGLFFIYSTMDDVLYDSTDAENRLTLVKRLPA